MTVHLRTVLSIGLLALASFSGLKAQAGRVVKEVRIDGGSEDDRQFAAAALGLKPGQALEDTDFQQALNAVRLVDRYRLVEGAFSAEGEVILRLDPLTPVATWQWTGDPIPSALRKTLLPELRKGQRLGPQRLAVLTRMAEQRLRDVGYPLGKVEPTVEQGGRHLRLALTLGIPSLIREIRIEGDPAPYTREQLLKVAGLQPDASLWTPSVALDAQRRLRRRMVKDHRLEGFVRLEPAAEAGVMQLDIRPGPKVTLKAKGLNILAPLWGRPTLSEFVPLARAERYLPSLLEEGAGRITTYFRNQGYPEAKVSFDRVVTRGTADHPEAVTLTFTVDHGPQRNLGRVQFEGNKELTDGEVRAVVSRAR